MNNMTKISTIMLTVAVALTSASCSKKDETKMTDKQATAIESFTSGKSAPPEPAPLPTDQTVDVPAYIKAKYKKVTMGVGDRKTLKVVEFEVKIGGEAKVPGTDYTIAVQSYLPHWMLSGKTVTSRDDKPIDPAVRATIKENGKVVFDGYIFQKHKTPSFRTDKYAIGLIGAK